MAVPPGLSALSLNDAWVMIAWHLMCILVVPCQRLNPGGKYFERDEHGSPFWLAGTNDFAVVRDFFKSVFCDVFSVSFSQREVPAP